jgi:uncharacterized protein YecT (DUF1311 family)
VGLESTDVRAIAIDPTDPATLYAGTGSGSGPARIFKSTDGGATWAPSDVDRRAKASNPTGVDPRERKDPRVTNEDVAAQMLKDLATIDERMAQVFQALRGVLPEMNRAELVAQKRSWGERRDSACRMVERDLHPEKWRQQIRLDPLKLLCLLHVSRNRLEEMETALKSKRLPNVLPERSAKGVLGDTRKYLISEEAGGFKNSRGRSRDGILGGRAIRRLADPYSERGYCAPASPIRLCLGCRDWKSVHTVERTVDRGGSRECGRNGCAIVCRKLCHCGVERALGRASAERADPGEFRRAAVRLSSAGRIHLNHITKNGTVKMVPREKSYRTPFER